MVRKKVEKKAFTVRVRETVVREYDVEAASEVEAAVHYQSLSTCPPMDVDLVDWEVQSVKAAT